VNQEDAVGLRVEAKEGRRGKEEGRGQERESYCGGIGRSKDRLRNNSFYELDLGQCYKDSF